MESGTGEITECRIGGARFRYRHGSVDRIVLSEEYQRFRFPGSDGGLAESRTVIDAGAHVGAFAVAIAEAAPSATVYALEPAESSYALLRTNVQANRRDNVVPLQLALGGTDADVLLHQAAENWGHSLHPSAHATPSRSERVRCRTLDTFLREHGLETVDLLKMNIEGGEYDVILSSPAATLRQVRRMAVEVHPLDGYRGTDVVTRLRDCGFVLDVSWSHEEQGKGWIEATLPDRPGT